MLQFQIFFIAQKKDRTNARIIPGVHSVSIFLIIYFISISVPKGIRLGKDVYKRQAEAVAKDPCAVSVTGIKVSYGRETLPPVFAL